jgi:Transglutaminase-like superfamily
VNRLRRKFNSFTRQSRLSQVLLIPAWCLTGLARASVLIFPFKCYASTLGRYAGLSAVIPLAEARQYQTALGIGRAVRMAANYTPWHANCQAQAIAARCLLGLFGVPYALFYGVANAPEQAMKAHAWVCCGPVPVTGGYAFDEFTVVAVFTDASLPSSLPRKGGEYI